MIILALDTTSEYGGIALRSDGNTLAERTIHAPDGFAHLLFPALRDVLAEAGVRFAEIDCFAAASGPGSFTGVRIGLAAVKGLATATDKPAAGISNLRALSLFGKSPRRAVVLDARRGQVYAAVYDEHARIIVPETVASFAEWLAGLPPGQHEFVRQKGSSFGEMPFTEAPRSLAAAVARCAEQDGPSGWSDPAALDANYVRRSDAELFWRDK